MANKQFPEVVTNPSPQIGIESFGDSSVNINYRYWVHTLKYGQTLHAVNLAVLKALQAAQMTIPFLQP